MGEVSNTLSGGEMGQVTVQTFVTEIVPASLSRRDGVLIYNKSTEVAYVGIGETVSTSTGFPLTRGASLFLPTKSKVVGIVASNTADIRYVEI